MKQKIIWPDNVREAKAIQEQIKSRLRFTKGVSIKKIKLVAGADVSFRKSGNLCFGTFVLLTFPELQLIEQHTVVREADFPYVPGYLTFREGPVLLEAFGMLSRRPDVILFDGQGIAHPRGVGVAAHMGVLLETPSIGVAKTLLVGDYVEPAKNRGSQEPLFYKGKTVGTVLRTKDGVKPVFISVGHMMDLETAVDLVLKCDKRYRLPEPVRQAHIEANKKRVQGV